QVDEGDAARRELGRERGEDGGEAREVVAWIALAADARARALSPVRRAGDDDVDGGVGQIGGEGEAVARRDAAQGERAEGGGRTLRHYCFSSASACVPLPVLKKYEIHTMAIGSR